MSRPPRPRATTAVETAFRHDVVAWSSPGQQVPQGFEDPEARRGDGTEFADGMSQDCKRMCTVQGRRQEEHEICLDALLENSEGQA
ncbi:hypothetical protein C2845_PMPSC055735 [Panicum miliaceum]|uniref:Uncharacterized protein n=1 Tax=Panicum miliaceum TaxID=4540 RepID=A0A3L6P9G4_PANMI|nr:hypothetical protein C2845_PMPSC055735 [Panicum miliaceum]